MQSSRGGSGEVTLRRKDHCPNRDRKGEKHRGGNGSLCSSNSESRHSSGAKRCSARRSGKDDDSGNRPKGSDAPSSARNGGAKTGLVIKEDSMPPPADPPSALQPEVLVDDQGCGKNKPLPWRALEGDVAMPQREQEDVDLKDVHRRKSQHNSSEVVRATSRRVQWRPPPFFWR